MWASQTISYFAIKYFDYYYNRTQLYGSLSAIAILVGGGLSNLIAGRLSDKYEAVDYRTKSYVGSLMTFLAVPLCCLCFLLHFNFYFSLAMFFFIYLFSEGWMGPNIAMI
jgi:MFS family permease